MEHIHHIGVVRLEPDGAIGNYFHPNEARWSVDHNGHLLFHHQNGNVTTRFDRANEDLTEFSGSFLPDTEFTHRLRKRPYAAIAAIIKDEKPEYLREWVEYHHMIGFEYFLIYDNDSRIPVAETLKDFPHKYIVPWPGWGNKVAQAYDDLCANYKHIGKWVAVIDGDEFIVPKKAPYNIQKFLKHYEDYSAVAANWLMFGSSGVKHDTPGYQTQKFLRHGGPHDHVKSIIQVDRAYRCFTPHHFCFYYGNTVNENGTPLGDHRNWPATTEHIQINHYFYKTFADWQNKCRRGRADGVPHHHEHVYWRDEPHHNKFYDRSILNVWDYFKNPNPR
jgi:hypothetical protein